MPIIQGLLEQVKHALLRNDVIKANLALRQSNDLLRCFQDPSKSHPLKQLLTKFSCCSKSFCYAPIVYLAPKLRSAAGSFATGSQDLWFAKKFSGMEEL